MNAMFAKLKDGSWGARVVGSKPAVGDTVSIVRKDGGAVAKRIDRVIWSGGGAHLCAISDAAVAGGPGRRSSMGRSSMHSSCGYPCPVDGHRCTPDDPCHDCG